MTKNLNTMKKESCIILLGKYRFFYAPFLLEYQQVLGNLVVLKRRWFLLIKKYLVLYVPAIIISAILYFTLPQHLKYLIIIPPGIAGVIYNIWSKRPIR